MASTADFLIIGGGIVGLSLARQLRISFGSSPSIVVLEKEMSLGLHSSGRNSGVMHSGIYYPAGSLKARVCGEGAREMVAWCEDRGLPVRRCGKVLVPVKEEDGPQVSVLLERARQNGVRAERLDGLALAELEPEARSATGEAIWCPDTSVIDPKAVLKRIAQELQASGVAIRTGEAFRGVDRGHGTILTTKGRIGYGHAINAAGLHADRVAHAFGVGERYTLLPFRGAYWKLAPGSGLDIRGLIYPVPDLNVPFLGVHTTTSTSGSIYFGPTAMPALGRENYTGLSGVEWAEIGRIVGNLGVQFVRNKQGFQNLAFQESRKALKPGFVRDAQRLVPRLRAEHLLHCDKVGLRAQMLDLFRRELVMDFLIEKGEKETHILNAVSPAFTSALAFSRYVTENFLQR
jgi:L-2-hydroxyglutarate oxidase LhgO